ncbi:hypothetical protein PG999_014521 [Apiospora kogelbergensis]|uniref:Uncharacterized protein n=1 Tax=Apiospora kogelbergensis TaxID=1337665 RepID=A0AAW0Q549_9PEZI
MPAVSLPLQQVKSNAVALAIESPNPTRLVSNLAFLAVCLLLVVAYYFKFASWDRTLLAQNSPSPQPLAAQRDYFSRLFWGRSREISSSKPAMPTNKSSGKDRKKGDHRARPQQTGNPPYWVQQHGDPVPEDSPVSAPAQERIPRVFSSRPPPPPPMTPLAIETGPFQFQERQHSAAVSIAGDATIPFYQHQNPDYSAGSSAYSTAMPGFQGYSASPQQVSYTRTLTFNSPQDVSSAAELDTTIPSFSPHSFPSSNPLLPPPHDSFSEHEVEVHGDVISVMDDAGMGWKRHTRVYGGGVCLACLASGGEGDDEGGFYGPNVPLEDRRY